MIVPNQYFNVKIVYNNIQHYLDLGYDVKKGDIITVPLEHLKPYSKQKIKMICDYCGKEYETEYASVFRFNLYNKRTYCKTHALIGINLDKYGTTSCMQVKENVEQMKKTKIEKYGAIYTAEMAEKQIETKTGKYGENFGKIAHEKAKQTNLDKFGYENAMQNPKIREKQKQTVVETYGVDNISKSVEIKEKKKNTFIERYGVESPMQCEEFIKKQQETFKMNDSQKTSSQQIRVFDMIKELCVDCDVELNYQFRNFCFDIALIKDDLKIDIEYDGQHWHQDAQYDRRRDEVSKSYGWKILRIKSSHKIPTNEQLEEAINKLINGYSYTEIKLDDWKEAEIA